jgi:phage-related protein
MILTNDFLRVTIKDITFRSTPNPSADRDFFLDSTALTGWDDGLTARRQVTQRPVSNGDFADIATMGARSVTLTGAARAKTPQDLHAMRDQFMGLLADGGYTQMTVENSAGTRYATVGQDNTPSWVQQADTFASFKIDLFQPDPNIYGVDRLVSIYGAPTASGGLLYTSTGPASANPPQYLSYPLDYSTPVSQQTTFLFNNGNVNSWPTFTVAGNFYGGFTITDNKGNNITYTGDASLLAPVVIDSKSGTATQNGQDRSTLLTSRQWFPVPPGATIQPSFNPVNGATGWCDIIYKDTWI